MNFKYPSAKILVFAKAPVEGKVKTRLASSIGDLAALRFHEQMLERTLEMVCRYKLATVELHVSGNPDHPVIRSLAKQHGIIVKRQQGSDLGERMHYALEQSLIDSRYSVLIGTDCPEMNVDYLANAFTALVRGQDAVLGPAEDGGYVLIGARQLDRGWFSDIAWGSHHVLEQSRKKIMANGAQLEELQALWDVDQIADFERWQLQSGVTG
jgi:rSAM/selenodomain-associated transferase 1